VDVREVKFIGLIEGAKQFQIPLYQRAYTWKTKQVDRLCQDIIRIADSPHDTGHFLGSLILQTSPLDDEQLRQWTVVDGQQRLASLLIALAALRDHVRPFDPEWANRIEKEYLINEFERLADRRLRMLPTQVDREDFRECVTGNGSRLPSGPIGTAYRVFLDWFGRLVAEGGVDRLRQVERTVRNRLLFVEVVTGTADNVHQIFETINDRGLRLSSADLIRNYFFMLLPTQADAMYSSVWLPMQQRLGEHGLETLLWLDLVMRGHETSEADNLYGVQVERLSRVGPAEEHVAAEMKPC
jgi:hypothetical protein